MQDNLPAGAALNPSAPYNQVDPIYSYDVFRFVRKFNGTTDEANIGSFETLEQAKAAIGNTTDYQGIELWVRETDVRTQDSHCVFSAEWDEDLCRYVNA